MFPLEGNDWVKPQPIKLKHEHIVSQILTFKFICFCNSVICSLGPIISSYKNNENQSL